MQVRTSVEISRYFWAFFSGARFLCKVSISPEGGKDKLIFHFVCGTATKFGVFQLEKGYWQNVAFLRMKLYQFSDESQVHCSMMYE